MKPLFTMWPLFARKNTTNLLNNKMTMVFAFCCMGLFLSPVVYGQNNGQQKHVKTVSFDINAQNIDFVANKGQWLHDIRYKAEITDGVFYMTGSGFVFNFVNQNDWHKYNEAMEQGKTTPPLHFHAYKMNFVGANPAASIKNTGIEKRSYYHNYFIDDDSTRWQGHVGVFGGFKMADVYNGINLKVKGYHQDNKNHSLEYEFIVQPNANPNQIQLAYEGVQPTLDEKGNVVIQTTVNKVVEKAPYCYQNIDGKKVAVVAKYVLEDGNLSFVFPNGYNSNYALVIDPAILVFATYSGGTSSTFYAHATTFEPNGNNYASGLATGFGWPTTAGAYQQNYPGMQCACINKYNSVGSQLLFSTYFGASGGYVEPNTMRVDRDTNLVLAGSVSAFNLPTTSTAYQPNSGGGNDIYVSKLSRDGSTLLASTYVGGSGNEASLIGSTAAYTSLGSNGNPRNPVEVVFDDSNNVWVTSNSGSANFPVTNNAIQSNLGGSQDAVVFKLNSTLSNLMYSTYLGGNGWDGGIDIEFVPNGNVTDGDLVVVGMTSSANFPTTDSVLHPNQQGGNDGFVARINSVNGDLVSGTYLGTGSSEDAERVAFDQEGNIVVSGKTQGTNYPISPGAWSSPGGGIYIQKLTPDLKTSLASTRIASNTGAVVSSALMVDVCNNIIIGIPSNSRQSGLELTPDAYQNDPAVFYFAILTPNLNNLIFGSYFGTTTGSEHYHPATSRIDKRGIYYQSVCNTSLTYPGTTPNSWSQTSQNSTTNDVVTFKFQFPPTGVQANINLSQFSHPIDSACVPYTLHLTSSNTAPDDSCIVTSWDPGDGSQLVYDTVFNHTYTEPGVYHIILHAHCDSACITDDTTSFTLILHQLDTPDLVISDDTMICDRGEYAQVWVHNNNPDTIYGNKIDWQPHNAIVSGGDQEVATVNPSVSELFYVDVRDSIPGLCGITKRDSVRVRYFPRGLKILNNDTTVCKGARIPIRATSAPDYTFSWSPTDGVSDTSSLTPIIIANHSHIYTLVAHHPGCPDTAQTLKIDVEDYPVVDMGADKEICQWEKVSLSADVHPYRDDYTYEWTPTTGLDDPNAQNTYFSADSSMWYYFTVTTPIGCATTDSIHITVFPGNFGLLPDDTGFCWPGEATLHAGGGVKYQWVPSYGLDKPESANPKAQPHTTTDYTVYITDVHGCKDTGEALVTVYAGASIALPDSVVVFPGEKYHLEPSTNALYFNWFPTNGISNTDVSDPTFNPTVRTRYFVTATTASGCSITDSVDILVKGSVFDVPNAFTPGNRGANHIFKVEKRGIVHLTNFAVFNRWGQKLFSTTDIDQGWDGTYKGKPQPMGVYVYIVEGTTEDGKTVKKTGNVTLIR